MLKILIMMIETNILLFSSEDDLIFDLYLDNFYAYFSSLLIFLSLVWGLVKALDLVKSHHNV